MLQLIKNLFKKKPNYLLVSYHEVREKWPVYFFVVTLVTGEKKTISTKLDNCHLIRKDVDLVNGTFEKSKYSKWLPVFVECPEEAPNFFDKFEWDILTADDGSEVVKAHIVHVDKPTVRYDRSDVVLSKLIPITKNVPEGYEVHINQ